MLSNRCSRNYTLLKNSNPRENRTHVQPLGLTALSLMPSLYLLRATVKYNYFVIQHKRLVWHLACYPLTIVSVCSTATAIPIEHYRLAWVVSIHCASTITCKEVVRLYFFSNPKHGRKF